MNVVSQNKIQALSIYKKKKKPFRIVVQPKLITTAHISPVRVHPDVPVRIPPTVLVGIPQIVPAIIHHAAQVRDPPTVPVRIPPIGLVGTLRAALVRSPLTIPQLVQVRSPTMILNIAMIIMRENKIIITSNIKLNHILRNRIYPYCIKDC